MTDRSPNGSRLSCGRPAHRRESSGRQSVPARAQHSASFKAITARPLQALVRHPLTAPGSLECERPDARLGRPNPTPSF